MGILDFVVIGLAVLFLGFGYYKGIVKQLLGMLAWIVALVAAFMLCKTVAGWILETQIGTNMTNGIVEWFGNKNADFLVPLPELTGDFLSSSLGEAGVPTFLHKLILGNISESMPNISVASYLAPKIANIALICISFIVLFIVVFIIIKILAKVIGGAVRGSMLGFIDGLLGAVWGLVKVTIFISLAMLLLSFIVSIPSIGDNINAWITNDMKLGEEGFGIAKFVYENNPILWLISKYTNFGN